MKLPHHLSAVAAVLIAASVVVLPACGDEQSDDQTTSSAAPTTSRPADGLSDAVKAAAATSAKANGIEVRFEECYLGGLATALGEERALKINGDGGSSDDKELAAIRTTADGCYTPEVMSGVLGDGMSKEFGLDGASKDRVRSCMANNVGGRVGELAAAFEVQDAKPGDEASNSVITEVIGSCVDVRIVAAMIGGEANATPEDVDCIATQLDGKVTFADFLNENPAAIQAATAAGVTCGLAR